nr:MAG TPA: hypothetical protein [Caudoviricetes sp.]
MHKANAIHPTVYVLPVWRGMLMTTPPTPAAYWPPRRFAKIKLPKPSCHVSNVTPSLSHCALTAENPVDLIPLGTCNSLAASDSRGVELLVTCVNATPSLRVVLSVDRLNLPSNIHQPLRQRRQITRGSVRIFDRPSNTVTHRDQQFTRGTIRRGLSHRQFPLGSAFTLGRLNVHAAYYFHARHKHHHPCCLCESSACHANKPLPRIKLNTDTINHAPTARLLTSLNEQVNAISRHGALNKHDRQTHRLNKAACLLVRHMI